MLKAQACRASWTALALVLLCWGCSDSDRGEESSQGPADASARDAAVPADSGPRRSDRPEPDAAANNGLDSGDEGERDAASPDDAATDAGNDAAEPDREPPTLLSSTPTEGDDNVASNATWILVFSEPVTVGEGALVLRQDSPARAIAVTATASDDGQRLELTLDELPDLPAELTLERGSAITDLAGNPLEPIELHVGMPVWLRLGDSANRDPAASATDVRVALAADERPVLLGVESGNAYASRWRDGAFEPLGGELNQTAVLVSPGQESSLALAIDGAGAPIAAFRESSGVSVVRWDGSAWQALAEADPEGGGSYAPALALGSDGAVVVAFDALDGSAQPVLRVRTWTGNSWQTLGDLAVDAQGVRLAGDGASDFALAYQSAATGIVALRGGGSALTPLAGGAAARPATSGSFALSAAGTQVYVSAQGQGSVSLDAGGWRALPTDLAFVNSSAAGDRVLAQAPDASLLAAFTETPLGEPAARVYAQRLDGARFQPLGPVLNRDRRANAGHPALAVTAGGIPVVAFLEAPPGGGAVQVFVSRFNGDPAQPPTGMRERLHDAACLASAPADGSLLTDTGCFADALGRQPVPGFIPFDVISPLWSDGAFKRRFFMLPEGASITYRDPGIWTFPAGTILIKEFALEAQRGDASTIRPIETRFLIVRDGGEWDRYSYEWNQAGTSAVLRAANPATSTVDFQITDENGTATVQTHFFPNRAQCLNCHQTPGTVLGPQTAMFNRNFEYAGAVDNQLRTLAQLGVFGSSFTSSDLALARTMPSPADTTYSTEARLRAYLHANCSSCHHPLEALDLRIEVATLDTGLCGKITKGNLDNSILFWRDVRRGYPGQPGVAPMPPLGTLIANPLLEPLETTWILDPQNPCP